MFCSMYPRNLHNSKAVEITRESDMITTRKIKHTMITTHIKRRDKEITITTANKASNTVEVSMITGITKILMMTSPTPLQLLNLRVRTAKEGTNKLPTISKADNNNNNKPEVWILINRMTTMSKRAIPIKEPDLHLEVEAVVEEVTRTMVETSMVLVSL